MLETRVVVLITQRSRVQIPARYQGQGLFLEQRNGLLHVVCVTDTWQRCTFVPDPALSDPPGAPCGLPEGKRQLRALSAHGTINS